MTGKPTKKQTQQLFDKLLSESANKTCIDCQTFNPQWASVNNGCFFCIKCAGAHRGMGVHITFVRSVTMDSWSALQLERIKCGGNARLKKFWKQQKFPKTLTLKEKYDNDAMVKYREYMLQKARKENPSPVPFIGYQSRMEQQRSQSQSSLMTSHSPNSANSNNNFTQRAQSYGSDAQSGTQTRIQGFGNTDYQPAADDNAWNDMVGDLGNWASSFATKTTEVASDLASKSKVAATSFSETATQKASSLKNKITDEEFQASVKENASQTWTTTTTTLSSWWTTASSSAMGAYNNAIDNSQTLYNRDDVVDANNPNASRKKMDALSSDAYFHRNTSQNAPTQSHDPFPTSAVHNARESAKQPGQAQPEPIDLLTFDDQDPVTLASSSSSNRTQPPKKAADEGEWGFGGGTDDFTDDAQPIQTQPKVKPKAKPKAKGMQLGGSSNNQSKAQVKDLLTFDDDVNASASASSANSNTGAADNNNGTAIEDDLDAFFNDLELSADEEDTGEPEKYDKKSFDEVADEINDLLTGELDDSNTTNTTNTTNSSKEANSGKQTDEDWGW